MNVSIHPDPASANAAAAAILAGWLMDAKTRNIMLAAGNTPLDLYRQLGARKLPLGHLEVFVLDEYLGVPLEEPRNCANVLRQAAAGPWEILPGQFHTLSSQERDAVPSVAAHERRIAAQGGLDILVLGLGQNGHLGFNEPGTPADSEGRIVDLAPSSVAANRKWFGGDYAPNRGVTVGLKTILTAKRVMIMAYGPHKASAVTAMLEGPVGEQCPASFLRAHTDACVFLDEESAPTGKKLR